MNISSLARLSELLQRLSSDDGPGASSFERSQRGQLQSERRSIRSRRRGRGQNAAPTPTDAPDAPDTPAPPATTEPPQEQTGSPGTPAAEQTSLDTLAEMYVQQYQQNAGVTLSDEEFARKKTEVANFYSKISGGTERLDAVVFANDTQVKA
jgi:hypothetical protein